MSENNTFSKYLGPEFQQNLMWQLLVEPEFCDKTINNVSVDYFDDPILKRLFIFMKDYFKEYEKVPNLQNDSIILAINKYKSPNNVIEEESLFAVVQKIKILNDKVNNGEVLHSGEAIQKETNFFIKQQEYRGLGEFILDKTKTGEIKNKSIITEIEEKIEKIVHIGDEEDYGTDVFEGIEEVFRKDFRETIPTGITVIDAVTGGGLGKGEVGLILAPGGVGKAQPLSAKILTPTGWTLMGDIKENDLIIGSDGKSQKVLGVYPQGIRPIYKITFNDNTSTLCDEEHLWSVSKRNTDITEILTTNSLKALIKEVDYKIPIIKPVEFNNKTNVDLYEYGLSINNTQNNTIPNQFKYSSISNRISLLEGILDGKGYFQKNGIISYYSNSYRVVNDIKEIVLSLGGYCAIEIMNTLDSNNVIYVANIRYYDTDKYIKSISYSHEEEAQCIFVENEDHLYVTDDYILTHNTTILTKIANTGHAEGRKVLQIIMEDTVKQIQRKHSTIWSGIKLSELEDRSEEVIEAVLETHKSIKHGGKLLIKHFSQENTTMMDIRKWIIKYQKKVGYKFDEIILDYLDCVNSHKKSFDKNEAELVVVKSFLALADDFNIPAWSAIQGNRGSYSADFLNVNDMGGSIKRYQKAHFFMSVAKPEDQKDTNLANVRILKARFAQDGQSFKDSTLDNDKMEIILNDFNYGNRYTNTLPKTSDIKKAKIDNSIMEIKMREDAERMLNNPSIYTMMNNVIIPETQIASATVGDSRGKFYDTSTDEMIDYKEPNKLITPKEMYYEAAFGVTENIIDNIKSQPDDDLFEILDNPVEEVIETPVIEIIPEIVFKEDVIKPTSFKEPDFELVVSNNTNNIIDINLLSESD